MMGDGARGEKAMGRGRFFLALLPPQGMQDYANQVRQRFVDRYDSCKALNSPPHITLQPPFVWEGDRRDEMVASLADFCAGQVGVPVTLKGFGAFAPRVIFIGVERTAGLMAVQAALVTHCREQLGVGDRPAAPSFNPHITVAFRDLTPANFHRAWAEFAPQPLGLSNQPDGTYQFVAPQLTLLHHDGQRWQVCQTFELAKDSPHRGN
jgi:2'-5' RNA ligase